LIIPNLGYAIQDVLVDGESIMDTGKLVPHGSVYEYIFTNIVSRHTIHAAFRLDIPPTPGKQTIIATSISDAHVAITPAGQFEVDTGSSLSFTVTALPGSEMTGLYINGMSQPVMSSFTLTADKDYLVQVAGASTNGILKPEFRTSHTEVARGGSVLFIDTTEGNPIEWRWDFGDTTGSTDQHPTHSYAAPGQYPVTLWVKNPYNSGALSRKQVITVT
jgi:hypothetical protein